MTILQPAQIDIGGLPFTVRRLDAHGLPGWALVAESGVSARTLDGYVADDFLASVRELDSGCLTVSRWPLQAPEFGWPPEARSCDCLADQELADVASGLTGAPVLNTPGPIFDHFLMRSDLVDRVGAHPAALSACVGLDSSLITIRHVDPSPQQTRLREALAQLSDSWLRDAFVRALREYFRSGVASAAGDALRRAYVARMLALHGGTFATPAEGRSVTRRVVNLNSVRLVESVCCTSVEHVGHKLFATPLEAQVGDAHA